MKFFRKILILAAFGGFLCPLDVVAKSRYSLFLGYRQPLLDVEIDEEGKSNNDGRSLKLLYQPPYPHIVSLGMTVNDFSISVSRDISEETVSVEYHAYSLSWYHESFGFDLSYIEFHKFEIVDANDFANELPREEIFRDDMKLGFSSAHLLWFPLGWHFDLEAAFDPSYPKTTAFGLGTILTAHQFTSDSELGLIPADLQGEFGEDAGFTSSQIDGTDLELSFASTIALADFYITFFLGYGIGEHRYSYVIHDTTRNGSGRSSELTWRVSTGYSGKSWYWSIDYLTDEPTYQFEYMSLSPIRSDLNFVMGRKL